MTESGPLASAAPFATITGVDDVNPYAVRRLLEALEWDLPDGTGANYVPLSCYLTFAMPAYREPGKPIPPRTLPPLPYHLQTTRFSRAMAVTVEVAAGAPMAFGDRLTSRWYLADVRERRTRLGPGVFLTFETDFVTQRGVRVATERTVVLNFDPCTAGPTPPAEAAPPLADAVPPGPDFDRAAPAAGQRLASARLPLTLQRLAMIAGANRDYAPIHHDPEAAREIGARAPVANSMVLLSLVERLILDNGAAGARAVRLGPLRLVRPASATGMLECSGRVTDVRSAPEGRVVTLDVSIAVEPDGVTAAGSAEFLLSPAGSRLDQQNGSVIITRD